MAAELVGVARVVSDSPWLGKEVTDHLGRPAIVRRVYDVNGQHTAVLTSSLPAIDGGEAISGEHVDLLSTGGNAPVFPGYQDKLSELADLESTLHSGGATEEDALQFRAAHQALKPYQQAEYHLRQALIDQAEPGDRVYLTGKDWYGTVADIDDDPLHDLPRMALRIRLDDSVLNEKPHLLERHPEGTIELTTLMMWPTLGLI
ncbi:hypothetical protein ABZV92_19990 [Streptomyces rubiginosohelvolus]|uniref:hypothetical protein n=1 Tax=Streptomyces rubiginosohelvolus TaxID=67362 RepID=UPI0033A6D0DF